MYGLPPGDYAVSAELGAAGSDDLPGYPLTYFPGTTNPAEAQRVRIGLAEEVSNVEFVLAPTRTARITGRTFTSSGEPFTAGVQMRPSWRSTGATAEAVGARALPDGGFEFPNVPPGEYVIQAFKGIEIGCRDGSFEVRGLPASEYFVAAVDWLEPSSGYGEWQDPEVLEALARRANRVTLADGQRVQLALKLVPR